MTSPLWRHPVTWRHRNHFQSIDQDHFFIGCPLEPSRYLASFPRYLAPKFDNDYYVMRLMTSSTAAILDLVQPEVGPFDPPSRKPNLGSNTKSIGRSVAEIWPFETLNLMTSLMTSQGPDPVSVKKNYFPQVGDHRVKISAQLDKNWRRRSISKKCGQNLTIWQSHELDWEQDNVRTNTVSVQCLI